jgi:ankyrin repeat protein
MWELAVAVRRAAHANRRPPLHQAIVNRDHKALEDLIDLLTFHGELTDNLLNAQSRRDNNFTPICLAISVGDSAAVDILLRAKQDVQVKDGKALELAILEKDMSSARSLLQHSPQQQLLARSGAVLKTAAYNGHVECLEMLLNYSPAAQVELKDQNGLNALMYAADSPKLGSEACVQLLLKYNPIEQVRAVSLDDGGNALTRFIAANKVGCIALLLQHDPETQLAEVGAEVDPTLNDEFCDHTPLMCAASLGRVDCIKLLLPFCSNDKVSKQHSISGENALMLALAHGHSDCARLLFERTTQWDVEDDSGNTVLDCCVHYGQHEWMDTVLAKISEPKRMDKALAVGCFQLRTHRKQRVTKCLEYLLAEGAQLPAEYDQFREVLREIISSLHQAARVPDRLEQAVLNVALKRRKIGSP